MGYFGIHYSPDYRDENFLGEINIDSILNEDQVGITNVPKLGNLKIYVYGIEGPNPHMHIFNESINFETCLCLYKPMYFLHGSKIDTLNKKQLKEIDKFLRTKYKDTPMTKWQMACIFWDSTNNTNLFKYSNKQPDYSMTTESIH